MSKISLNEVVASARPISLSRMGLWFEPNGIEVAVICVDPKTEVISRRALGVLWDCPIEPRPGCPAILFTVVDGVIFVSEDLAYIEWVTGRKMESLAWAGPVNFEMSR